MNNNVVLCTSLDSKMLEILNEKEAECIYCYKKPSLNLDKNVNKKIIYIKFNDCKKIINKIDLIIIDLELKNKEQYLELKTLLKLVMSSELKPNLKLKTVKQSDNADLSDNSHIYQDYINYFLEGMIKFRGLLV